MYFSIFFKNCLGPIAQMSFWLKIHNFGHAAKKISPLTPWVNIEICFDRLSQNSEFLPQKPIRQQTHKLVSNANCQHPHN